MTVQSGTNMYRMPKKLLQESCKYCTVARNNKYTPFELMIITKMKNKDDLKIKEMLEEDYVSMKT